MPDRGLHLIACSPRSADHASVTGSCHVCGGTMPDADIVPVLWLCLGDQPLLVGCERCLRRFVYDVIWEEVAREPR